jgi:hypothetical protein
MTYIQVDGSGGIEVHDRLPDSVLATALSISRRFWERSRIYDEIGGVWRVEPVGVERINPSPLSRVLAATIYNPRRSVPVQYRRTGDYELPELKTCIQQAVDADDDVLTQFMDAADITEQLRKADSFNAVAGLLRRMTHEQRP